VHSRSFWIQFWKRLQQCLITALTREFIYSLYIYQHNSSSASLKEIWRLRKENWLLPSKKERKKKKTKFIDFDHAGNDKPLNQLLLSLRCWLMLARRFCVYNAGLKVDVAQEILTVIMTLNDENVCSCKGHTVVRHVFCYWRSLWSFLASRLTNCIARSTVSCQHNYKLLHSLVELGSQHFNCGKPVLFCTSTGSNKINLISRYNVGKEILRYTSKLMIN